MSSEGVACEVQRRGPPRDIGFATDEGIRPRPCRRQDQLRSRRGPDRRVPRAQRGGEVHDAEACSPATCRRPAAAATVNGFDIFHQSHQVRENLGYLPENMPLYTEMKVEEYLDFRGRLRGMDRASRRSGSTTSSSAAGWGTCGTAIIGHLSKGYRQRMGLADALLHNPAVLILDEPTVGLDPTQIRETRKLIKDLGGDHTVLLSTHILPEVEAVCDRAVVIAGGRIVAQGSPEELRTSRRMAARVLVECNGPAKEVENVLSRVSGVSRVEIAGRRTGRARRSAYTTFAIAAARRRRTSARKSPARSSATAGRCGRSASSTRRSKSSSSRSRPSRPKPRRSWNEHHDRRPRPDDRRERSTALADPVAMPRATRPLARRGDHRPPRVVQLLRSRRSRTSR